MDWRSSLLSRFGPGVLAGITFPDWIRLLRSQQWPVDLARLPRAALITGQSLQNSFWKSREDRRYDSALEKVVIQPPLFILGHWRSGTTLLHQLLSLDPRFSFPNAYQVSFPHQFLTREAKDLPRLSFFVPIRRPMDNMELSLRHPQEDEFALCAASLKSPCMGWVFPRRHEQFEKYLTFKTADASEITEWRSAFLRFARKLQWRDNRPLVFKSPPHTARIRLLLDLFPDAKFVHIHRNPYSVFVSSRKTFRLMFDWHGLHRPLHDDLDDWIFRQYREMFASYFAEAGLIPKGRLCEVRFETLECDPLGEVRRIYETLDLPDFRSVEPCVQRYVASLAGYQKNSFTPLESRLKARIAREWNVSLDAWNYPID